jgi:ATP-dependent protease HslVU (ClpYQ) peptidase subunit
MTTVVCSRTAMASDSLVSDGYTKDSAKKIFRIDGSLFGIAGDLAQAMEFLHAKAGVTETIDSTRNNWIVMELTPDHRILIYDGSVTPYESQEPAMAIGTGSAAARAALLCGKSIRRAVEIAISIDVQSGGDVQYLKL